MWYMYVSTTLTRVPPVPVHHSYWIPQVPGHLSYRVPPVPGHHPYQVPPGTWSPLLHDTPSTDQVYQVPITHVGNCAGLWCKHYFSQTFCHFHKILILCKKPLTFHHKIVTLSKIKVKLEMRKRCSVKCIRCTLHTFRFFIFPGHFTICVCSQPKRISLNSKHNLQKNFLQF